MTRRGFVGWTVAAGVAQALGQWLGFGAARAAGGAGTQAIPKRPLGRTGESVTAIGLGGSHIGRQQDPEESVRLIRAAVDGGITFLDNSWDYNGGESERRMGRALRDGYRARVFLMTKFDGRDQKSAARQIDESLRRLETDHVDLLQFHEIIRPSDPERIFAAHGAIEAALAARKAGKTRFIGFTGHKSPDLHLAMLRACDAHGFRPDTVQMPLNVMDASYESFEAKVLPELVRRGVGVLGMKPLGDGVLLESKAVAPEDGIRYAMSVPGVSVTITGIDSMEILAQALRIARGFEPLEPRRRLALREAAAASATGGRYELYKTSHHFDSTHQHPEWLG